MFGMGMVAHPAFNARFDKQWIIKEHTEYSASELAEVWDASRRWLKVDPVGRRALLRTSDDFEAAERPDAVERARLPARKRSLPIVKELTEFTQQEMAAVMDLDTQFTALSSNAQQLSYEVGRLEDFTSSLCSAAPLLHICKEHTEYSTQELEWLLADLPAGSPMTRTVSVSSDDFACPSDAPNSSARRDPLKKWCAERMEYSERELAMVLGHDAQCADESSDDFCAAGAGKTFYSWYHQNCVSGTDAPVKRTRRVYHNRRKTAWTDYDESGAKTPTAETPKAEAASLEVEEPKLIQLLKSGDVSKQQVRDVVRQEAARQPGGLPEVLRRSGRCGWPPLVLAVQRKRADAVTALLEFGAEADCKEPASGWTPLMYAAQTGSAPMVRELLAKGASANACACKSNWSPLCSAIQSGREEVVGLLLDAGADLATLKHRHPAIADVYMQEMRQRIQSLKDKPPVIMRSEAMKNMC